MHAIYKTYKEQQTEAVLLIDASNTFNLVKRKLEYIIPILQNVFENVKIFLPNFSSLAEEI